MKAKKEYNSNSFVGVAIVVVVVISTITITCFFFFLQQTIKIINSFFNKLESLLDQVEPRLANSICQ